jgi:hypothetical protein
MTDETEAKTLQRQIEILKQIIEMRMTQIRTLEGKLSSKDKADERATDRRRFEAAVAAMHGMVSRPIHPSSSMTAREAVTFADALLAELELGP